MVLFSPGCLSTTFLDGATVPITAFFSAGQRYVRRWLSMGTVRFC